MTARPGWLVEQLPRAMAEDPFLARFVRIFEHIGDSVRDRIDAVDGYFDVGLGPPEFVRWMASWVGQSIDPSVPEDRQRSLALAIGPLFPYRGTARGIEAMLAALTQSEVTVEDSGGVYRAGEAPPVERRVSIQVNDSGEVDRQQLLRIVQSEVPAQTAVELIVDSASVETEEAGDELERMVEASIPAESTPAPEEVTEVHESDENGEE